MNGKYRLHATDREAVTDGFSSRSADTKSDGSSQSSWAGTDANSPRSDEGLRNVSVHREALGEALAIDQVASLLGCSAWTVRQRYLREGLPYLQARPRGKLVFFREQVIAWIEKRQRQKGGTFR